YVRHGEAPSTSKMVVLEGQNGVRYTVPQTIDVEHMKAQVTVRFRVAEVYRDRFVCVFYDGIPIGRWRKKILAPGEMEQIVLRKESLQNFPDLKKITISTEEVDG
ncbi:MAG: pyridine nucleotide-disulfide oxidoreductase, partial [Hungatella sp.]